MIFVALYHERFSEVRLYEFFFTRYQYHQNFQTIKIRMIQIRLWSSVKFDLSVLSSVGEPRSAQGLRGEMQFSR